MVQVDFELAQEFRAIFVEKNGFADSTLFDARVGPISGRIQTTPTTPLGSIGANLITGILPGR
jgi:hypothetical protein